MVNPSLESDEVTSTRRELEELKASLEAAMKANNQGESSDVDEDEDSETGRNWKVDADVVISPIANTGPFHLDQEDSDASAGSPPAARSNTNANGTHDMAYLNARG
jgi:hypothetical protein